MLVKVILAVTGVLILDLKTIGNYSLDFAPIFIGISSHEKSACPSFKTKYVIALPVGLVNSMFFSIV